MGKNIIVCLDGTGNEFGDSNSNVVKLFQTLIRNPVEQVAFYHPGLGTSGFLDRPLFFGWAREKVQDVWSEATGAGLLPHVSDAYQFLMEHFEIGDKVFIFGFSRGAYTAKVLAALIREFGILDPGDEVLVPYASALLTCNTSRTRQIQQGFNKTFGRSCDPWFVGLFDAVSSIQWFIDPPVIPSTKDNPDIQNIRHAVSIDERRAYFRTNLYDSPENSARQDFKQVWFAGVHSDVGGGYPEAESSLSKIPLEWMLREAENKGLIVDPAEKATVLGRNGPGYVKPDFRGIKHESLTGAWWIAEYLPKYSWSDRNHARKIIIPAGRRRFIPPGATFHRSVQERMDDRSLDYAPDNIPKEISQLKFED